ncbi:MAG: hypothetical protein HKO65_08310 [Gemmatimonadetes bacterium]|nr:hypothetical protein [Gemmatimonadota bacterium]
MKTMFTRASTRLSGVSLLAALLSTNALAVLFWTTNLGAQTPPPITEADLQALQPRVIGPAVTGGRVHDIEALPRDPSTIFVASASGGLWKTTNRGVTWRNVFDTMAVSTFGDVAIAPSNPQIVYAGTGEQNNRQSTSWGNGVYRSDDGGESWRHLGLSETRHIGKVEVHPTDPDEVYVAALGNLWAPSAVRGVFKSTDGGHSWVKVFYVDRHTGVVDMVMDPFNPDVLYVAAYQRLRRAWGFNGGGPGSGIFKTTNGGATWQELTNGIPEGDKGRIGLAIAASNPSVLNAIIEHPDPDQQGTYRTEDGGASWERVNELNIRPMYYSEIFIDPSNENTVYALATSSNKSEDGGRTFEEIAVRPTYDVGVHADHHALWIDPNDPNHLYLGGDAGLHESYDKGVTFRKINNFPIAQFYAIGVDMQDPYWVFGGLQDNHSFAGPSRTRRWIGIVNDDWKQVGYGDGMYWQPDPTTTDFAYGTSNDGTYFRLNSKTGDMLDIAPEAPVGEEEYRFDWTSPIIISQHNPSTLFAGGNRLFISTDRGETWVQTEDLSQQIDRDTVPLMGVLGSDISISRNDGTGSFGEAVTIGESPVDPFVLWVGMDDGNLQVSRDAGITWGEVSGNVPELPPGTYVSRITPSATSPGAAYAAFDGHRDGDLSPYLFKTEDFGRTWEPLMDGLPSGTINDVIEHPDNPAVLFVGTEHHLFVSVDAGASWAKWPGLPTTHVDDLVIHPREKDLVIGTHGQSIWIVDDTRPLAEWASEGAAANAHLFSIRPATIFTYWKDTSYRGQAEFAGQNPADGAIITYRLRPGVGDAHLRIARENGEVVREYLVPSEEGLHRVNWDLRHPLSPVAELEPWEAFEDDLLPRSVEDRGHFVSPGTYTVTLATRGATTSTTVEVRGDPEMPLTQIQYQDREIFLSGIQELQAEFTEVLGPAQGFGRVGGGRGAMDEMTEAERTLSQHRRAVSSVYQALNGGGVRQGSLYPPTQAQRGRIQAARRALAEHRR